MRISVFFISCVFARYLGRTNNLNVREKLDKKDIAHPLVQEFLLSQELDEKTRKELLRPITHRNFHDPNVPLFEPFKLTESQQDILLTHD